MSIELMRLECCALLLWRRRQTNRNDHDDAAGLEQGLARGFAEEKSEFKDGSEEQAPDGTDKNTLRRAPRRPKRPEKWRRPFLKRHNYLIGFFSLVITAAAAAVDWLPSLQPQTSVASAVYKSADTGRFDALIDTASERSSNGEMERARDLYREALQVPNIPIVDRAVPMINIAKTLIEQGQFDRAYWPALLAADLRSDQPEFVNPFAEVLIEVCELDQAADRLEGLGLDKNERTHQLLTRMEAERSECVEP